MMKLLFSLSRLSSNGRTITLTFASGSVALRGSGVYDQLRLLAQPVNAAANKSPPTNRFMVSLLSSRAVIPATSPPSRREPSLASRVSLVTGLWLRLRSARCRSDERRRAGALVVFVVTGRARIIAADSAVAAMPSGPDKRGLQQERPGHAR